MERSRRMAVLVVLAGALILGATHGAGAEPEQAVFKEVVGGREVTGPDGWYLFQWSDPRTKKLTRVVYANFPPATIELNDGEQPRLVFTTSAGSIATQSQPQDVPTVFKFIREPNDSFARNGGGSPPYLMPDPVAAYEDELRRHPEATLEQFIRSSGLWKQLLPMPQHGADRPVIRPLTEFMHWKSGEREVAAAEGLYLYTRPSEDKSRIVEMVLSNSWPGKSPYLDPKQQFQPIVFHDKNQEIAVGNEPGLHVIKRGKDGALTLKTLPLPSLTGDPAKLYEEQIKLNNKLKLADFLSTNPGLTQALKTLTEDKDTPKAQPRLLRDRVGSRPPP